MGIKIRFAEKKDVKSTSQLSCLTFDRAISEIHFLDKIEGNKISIRSILVRPAGMSHDQRSKRATELVRREI